MQAMIDFGNDPLSLGLVEVGRNPSTTTFVIPVFLLRDLCLSLDGLLHGVRTF
jgi:hypothetical protein